MCIFNIFAYNFIYIYTQHVCDWVLGIVQDFSLFVCSEAARRVLPWPLVSCRKEVEDDGADVDGQQDQVNI